MNTNVILFFALVLIGTGVFLGVGIRTHQHIVEQPINLKVTEVSE